MFSVHGGRVKHEHGEENMKDILKIEFIDMKSTISEIITKLDGIYRLDAIEENTSDLKDIALKIIQSKQTEK